MVLVITLPNDGTIMTISVDRVLPSMAPDSWDLVEIFAFTVAYRLYLTLSTVILVIVILETTFFQDKFGISLENLPGIPPTNDCTLLMVIYLQVAIVSQALIFVTRSHGFFFVERPSAALFFAFYVARLVSIISAYGDWDFTKIRAISGGWIGIVWIWVCRLSSFFYALLTTSSEHYLVPPSRLRQVCDESHCHKYIPQRRERRSADGVAFGATGIPLVKTASYVATVHKSLTKTQAVVVRHHLSRLPTWLSALQIVIMDGFEPMKIGYTYSDVHFAFRSHPCWWTFPLTLHSTPVPVQLSYITQGLYQII